MASTALADAIDATLGPWVVDCIERRAYEALGIVSPELRNEALRAAQSAIDDVGPRVRSLLDLDIDAQRTTPLSIVREAVRYPTDVLRAAGIATHTRDAFRTRHFPEDDFDLTPTTLSVLGKYVGDLAIVWGAHKAMAHRHRHVG